MGSLALGRSRGANGGVAPSDSVWLLVEGASLGVLAGLCLTIRDLFDVLIDDRIGGVAVPVIHRFLATEYRSEVVRATGELLALAVVVGAAVGLTMSFGWLLRLRWQGKPAGPWWQRLPTLAGLWAWFSAWVYLHDVASRPALHQPFLLDRGGVRAALQSLVADVLGPTLVLSIAVTSTLMVWLWPLRGQLRGIRRRVVARGSVVFVAVALVVSWLTLGGAGYRQHAADGKPNVLVLAADSLRPDRIDTRRAPNLAKLLERATVFERAYTPLARTFPAWVSIATGQYPHHHGIRNMFPRWETRQRGFDTLALRLTAHGYHSAVVGDFAADIFRRVDLGYQRVETPTFTMRELVREHLLKNDPWLLAWVRGGFMRWLYPVLVEMSEATDPIAVSRDAIREIDEAAGQPFFVTAFYSTTHFPYAVPGPHHRRFGDPAYSGRFRYAKADTLSTTEAMTEADIAQVRALYDGAVFATDAAIGRVLDALERRGLRERTIIVVTADHGEQLYEFGRSQGHGDHLEGDEALRVPLVVVDPKRPTSRHVQQPVSLVDLAPTVLDMTGAAPLAAPDGRSLVAALDGAEPAALPIYSETGLWFTELIAEVPLSNRLPYPDLTQITEVDRDHSDQIVIRRRWEGTTTAAKHRMVQLGSMRLLYRPTRGGPRFQLCDLTADPACTRDCAREHQAAFEELKAHLFRFVEADPMVTRVDDVLLPREGHAPLRERGKVSP